MTSRRLWLLLTVLATPLVLYATTGCQVIFPIEEPNPTTNAYTCGCSCTVPNDLVSPVGDPNDDAEQNRGDGSVLRGNSDLRMTSQFLVGLRFAALGIPQGALISNAFVKFTAAQTDANAAIIAIRIEDSADAQPFTTTNLDISSRAVTATPVDWPSLAWNNGDSGTNQQTVDLSGLIQTVVNRSDWTVASSLVLIFDATTAGHVAVSANAAGSRQPVLHLTFVAGETFKAAIPVCLDEADNPVLTTGAGNPDTDGDSDGLPDVLKRDCENRVENTYRGLLDTCHYVPSPSDCNCHLVPTGFHDLDESGGQDPGEEYYGFTREICNAGPPTCVEELVDTNPATLCSNFDPTSFGACVDAEIAGCLQNGIPAENCNLDDCLGFVTATNAENADPICIAHASDAPSPVAFHLFGQRSTCEVAGLTHVEVGEDGREPKKSPLTVGTVEILGRPRPGAASVVGVATQLAMNPITFAVRWHSDPTFSNLIEAGNSSISAGSLNALGEGTLAAGTTANVGRGQRGSNKKAFLGTNDDALGLTVNWSGPNPSCTLTGNLAGAVDGESAGTCEGNDTVACLADSPDCDDAGGPCNLPDASQGMVVDVSLEGPLVNQPPTANAGDDQTIECTSPAGAAFELDGTQSFDPDDNIRMVSWRTGRRTGPEAGVSLLQAGSLGVGQGQTYVLRVIDAFAQADEDTTTAEVVDTTPPDVFCNSGTIVPPNKPAVFTATATDICTAGTIVPQLIDFDCFKLNAAGKVVDKTKNCKVTLSGPTITIKSTGGVGQHIAWIARGVDATGNVRDVTCEVVSANPGH